MSLDKVFHPLAPAHRALAGAVDQEALDAPGQLQSRHGALSLAPATPQAARSLTSVVARASSQAVASRRAAAFADYRSLAADRQIAATQAAPLKMAAAKAPATLTQMLEVAPQAKAELDELAQRLAEPHRGTVLRGPIKSAARAQQKIDADYGGDPARLKDLVRNTIVVNAPSMRPVTESLRRQGAAVKVIDGKSDPLGYSGVNSSMKTSFGIFGEIQVNTPAMLYAKQGGEKVRQQLGDAVFDEVASRTSVPGGLGHKLYEEWRVLSPDDPAAQVIAQKSRAYYDTVRADNGY
jgi:hypothetical protein